jgi:hypothetical protein
MIHPATNLKRFVFIALCVCSSIAVGGAQKEARCDLDWTDQGATIVKFQKDVLVSQSPFVPARIGTRVENGGRVMTLEDSTAVVSYDDGCWHIMEENQVLVIEDVSPCCALLIPPETPPAPVPVPAGAGVPLLPLAIAGVMIAAIAASNMDGSDDRRYLTPPQPPISQ